MNSNQAPRHHCPILNCGKSFIRKEHLTRHAHKHSPIVRSYICHACQRSFVRNDLLNRHLQGHLESEKDRNHRACDRCRFGKVRCVGGTPCTRCEAKQVECKTERVNNAATISLELKPLNDLLETDEIVVDNVLHPDLEPLSFSATKAFDSKPGEAYFTFFHHRWPILHVPTFDEKMVLPLLASSVRMIDEWLRVDPTNQRKETALSVYPILMDKILTKMTDSNSFDKSAESIELYQTCLLNVIFGLYCGHAKTFTKVAILLGVLVNTLREVDLFQPAERWSEASVEQTSMMQWVEEESKKRLAIAAFKVDACIAILRGHPPFLRIEEISLTSASTFALWNARDLLVWEARRALEPPGRAKVPIVRGVLNYSYVSAEDHSLNYILFPEDIQIGLLSVFSEIWQFVERTTSQVMETLDFPIGQREHLDSQLTIWNQRLESLSLSNSDDQNTYNPSTTGHIPHHFYYGLEVDPATGSEESIRRSRYDTLRFDAVDLHHLIRLYLTCNLRQLRALAAEEQSKDISTFSKTIFETWACSERARSSLKQCANILRSSSSFGLTNRTADPMSYIAYSSAAIVVWAFAKYYPSDGCNQHTKEYIKQMTETPHPELMALHLPENMEVLNRWLHNDKLATIYGVPVCRCRLDDLMANFQVRFPRGTGWASEFPSHR